eukprot:5784182-Amphidinium_carterae.2
MHTWPRGRRRLWNSYICAGTTLTSRHGCVKFMDFTLDMSDSNHTTDALRLKPYWGCISKIPEKLRE